MFFPRFHSSYACCRPRLGYKSPYSACLDPISTVAITEHVDASLSEAIIMPRYISVNLFLKAVAFVLFTMKCTQIVGAFGKAAGHEPPVA